MKLIVGLGNPGLEYIRTRHNIGFLTLDELKSEFSFSEFNLNKKFKAETSEGAIEGEKIILVKPQTYMNLSGEAVQKIASFYKVKTEDIWVIVDDIDLSLGKIRIRKEGSAGTHNGLKSLVQNIGVNFARFKIGIESRGEITSKHQDTSSFVLSNFLKEEELIIAKSIRNTVTAITLAIKENLAFAMNSYN